MAMVVTPQDIVAQTVAPERLPAVSNESRNLDFFDWQNWSAGRRRVYAASSRNAFTEHDEPLLSNPTGEEVPAGPLDHSQAAGQMPGATEPIFSPGPRLSTFDEIVAMESDPNTWSWQFLPKGLMYRSYLAGTKESRMGTVLFHDKSQGTLWDANLGGRVALVRHGSMSGLRPQGWEMHVEGAVILRQDPEEEMDVTAADYRIGVLSVHGWGRWQVKYGYYHMSAHLGDEFVLKNPGFERLNWKRDSLIAGVGYFVTNDVRLYGEFSYAFAVDGGAEPWEFQLGAEYSPITAVPPWGSPFAAINGHLRQEFNFGGSLTIQAGWQWLAFDSGQRLRIGFQYYDGPSNLYDFFRLHEQQYGIGLWFDY